jgi:Enoyl-CoA hydratase/carnithine racemase
MRTDYQCVLVQKDDAVLTITMNCPAVLNAINTQMLQELNEIAEVASADDAIRCVVLRGAGRAFGAGQDLSELKSHYQLGQLDVAELRAHLSQYHRLVATLHTMPKPVIAVLHGVATGVSLNLALACDLRIAAMNTRFSMAFARIGLVPDGGGTYFLTRLVGLTKALEIALLADEFDGHEAERIGLINKAVPQDELTIAVETYTQRLAQGPTSAYALIKQMLYFAHDHNLPAVFQRESELQGQAFGTADHQEGVRAFFERRVPHYSGK